MAHVPHAAARRSARLLAAAVASLFAATATAQQQVYEITGSGLKQTKAPEPGSDEATIAQARRLTADGNPSQAIDLLDAWIETNETARNQWLPDAFLARGDAHLADDDEYKALVDYERITRDYAGSDLFVKALERELDIAKMYLGGLRKKSLGLFRIDSGIPIAEEIIMRINERLPGSRLAERAMLMLADYYYDERDLRMAAESYDVFLTLFPRSEHRQKAMQRRVYANIAQFKGPRYDASGLVDAKFLVQRYQTQYPLDAERIGLDDTLTARLDEQTARQLLEVAAWYERRGDPPSQRLTLQRLVLRHPQTGAAKIAADILTKNNWPLQPKPRPPPPPPASIPASTPAPEAAK
jgi:outer membrane protein assembly factor BamD (BamD/ComL family)